MTSYLKFYKTGKSGKTLLWVIFLVVLLHKLLPNVPSSWESMIMSFSSVYKLIKWRPFMYVFVNFIIVSIFISSSNITHKLSNLLQKVHKKSSHNISTLISQTSQKFLVPFDDDTSWWSRVVNNEEREINPTTLEESRVYEENDEKTTSFEVKEEERNDFFDVTRAVGYKEEVVEEEEEEEFDTLDDTWKAIMEAKNKGSGPLLKKSGTWTAGDRGGGNSGGDCGGDDVVGKVGNKGRLSRYKVELKKWKTFNREGVQEKKDSRGGRGGGCDGGGDGGGRWRAAEVALTYHDDLKKRADAFIARVTHDMRLQRMESDQRFLDTINRGSK